MFYFGLCVCHFVQNLLSTWSIKCVIVNFLILLTFCSTEIICPDPPSLSVCHLAIMVLALQYFMLVRMVPGLLMVQALTY